MFTQGYNVLGQIVTKHANKECGFELLPSKVGQIKNPGIM
jgi:hypothetical protein